MNMAVQARKRQAIAASRRDAAAHGLLHRYVDPLDPVSVEHPPAGEDWIHEIKFDGYRAQAHNGGGRSTVFSRRGHNWTDRFGSIGALVADLPADSVILDGEVVFIGRNGKPDFQGLRGALGRKTDRLHFYAFDLLFIDGEDWRRRPLLERKRRLQALLRGAPEQLQYVEHMQGDSRLIVEHACKLGLEGIVSKQVDSPYKSGRQESWRKSKCELTDNFPIVAFVEKLGARPRRIASLYVGRREGDRLLYAGKVQSGYSLEAAREVREALDPYIRRKTPLSEPIVKPKATWVEPVVDAEVAYSSKTAAGLLREAVFKGLRDDLAETDVAPPAAAAPRIVSRPASKGVPPYNILQRLPDGVAPSEDALVAYWAKVEKLALEHLARRPLKLVRRVGHTIFYHKGPLPPVPDSVHELKIHKREGGEGVRLWIDDLGGLAGLVQIGAVELHPWNATVDDIEEADRMVFDLDPGEGIEWPFVIETALALRQLLQDEGFEPWPKVTGGKGLHLMVPLRETMPHDAAHARSHTIARRLVATDPGRYTVSAAMAARKGRLFIDYLRNGRGTTAVGAFSPRVRAGFPIAHPVTWTQVESGVRPDAYTMASPFKAAGAVARSPRRTRRVDAR
ncbi:bifunctional non-homologous end joining protein LigD [Rhodospirillales bacterium URHD0017]|nr:bifunctional non-homologous end joining protein LigD [Rhodospirillales bacterium URHD0017]